VREIPIKNFRDIWNQSFPDEKLHSKMFGYRDIRGLLANVPMLDRVGGKNHAKYVLKPEVVLESTDALVQAGQLDSPTLEPSWLDPNGIYGRSSNIDQSSWGSSALGGVNSPLRSQAPWASDVRPPGNWAPSADGAAPPQQQQQHSQRRSPLAASFEPPNGPHPSVLDSISFGAKISSALHRAEHEPAPMVDASVRPATISFDGNVPSQSTAPVVGEELRAAAALQLSPAPVLGSRQSRPERIDHMVSSSPPPGLECIRGGLTIARGSLTTSLRGQAPPMPSVSRLESVNEQDALTTNGEVNSFAAATIDGVPELSAAGEFRRKRKALKAAGGVKTQSGFVSSPGALSSGDRDASKHQGKFDMGALYQAQMDIDKYCMMVDFYNGRVLFSNTLCDNLFQTMTPLPQRDITDLIYEEDRLNFSAAFMYLSIGKFNTMDPTRLRIVTAMGVQYAMMSARQLADNLWRVDFELCEVENSA
jgi:hypothetical protein